MKKILVINDIMDNLIAIKEPLEDLIPDCLVLTAQTGKEGLKIAKEEQPDTILTDIHMPEMDGFEVCRKLKEDEVTRNIPVMIFTGSTTDAESRIQCLEAGADVFLTKPIDTDELTAQIHVMFRIKEAEDKLRAEKEHLDEAVQKRTIELKESEEALMLVIENISFAVFAHNLDGKFILVNKTSTKYTGYTKKELSSMTVDDIDHQSITRDDRENIWIRLLHGGHKQLFSTHFRKDGSQYPVEIHLTAITLKNEPVILVLVQDITERKQAEEELKISRERLKVASSILRHDISNDFIVIKSALDLYRDEQDKTMLDEIEKRVGKSLNTIKKQREQEQFIDSHSDLDEYDIEKVAQDVIKNYQDIKIDVKGAGRVYADNAIYSVFENIISNAIKHGKTNKLDIDINCAEEFCEIRFADEGIGIPNEIKYKIFDEGFQYGENGHTGIGLYIVQKTIDDYDGEIFVEDNKPQGAVFVIRLKKTIER